MIMESLAGVGSFALYMALSVAAVMAFMWLYVKFTPHNEIELIKANNPAAALTYVGTMVGFSLPLASAVAHSVSIPDFIIWTVVAAIIQLVVFVMFRKFYPLISSRIEAGEIAASIKLAGVSLTVGILNAASMTY